MDKEINVRGIVRPEISIQGNVTPTISFRGEVQKSSGAGGGMIIKTTAEWAALPEYKSLKGIWYIYSDFLQETDPDTGEVKNVPRGKIGDGVSYVEDLPFEGYPPILVDDLSTSVQVGGIDSGIIFDKGTLLEKIFRDMLNPLAYPTLTNPSLVLIPSGSLLLENGTSKMETITAMFSRGSINPAYGTSGYRSGEVQHYRINSGNAQDSNVFEVALDQLHNSFVGNASYAAGEQPKDSHGDDYDSPLPAGNVNSPALTYEFVNALWANISNASEITKCPLVSVSAKQSIY